MRSQFQHCNRKNERFLHLIYNLLFTLYQHSKLDISIHEDVLRIKKLGKLYILQVHIYIKFIQSKRIFYINKG